MHLSSTLGEYTEEVYSLVYVTALKKIGDRGHIHLSLLLCRRYSPKSLNFFLKWRAQNFQVSTSWGWEGWGGGAINSSLLKSVNKSSHGNFLKQPSKTDDSF